MSNVPKIVLERLQVPGTAAASHPDPDVLTAFAERALTEVERGRVLEHLSRCGECREVVALALPASEAIESTLRASRRPQAAWTAFRWVLASGGLVAVVLLGFLEYRHQTQPVKMAERTPVSASLQARNEPQPAVPAQDKAADGYAKEGAKAPALGAPRPSEAVSLEKGKDLPAPPDKTELAKNFSRPAIHGALAHGPRQANQWQQQNANALQAPAAVPVLNAPEAKQQAGGAGFPVPQASRMVAVEAQAQTESRITDSLVANNQVPTRPSSSDAEVSRAKSAPAAPVKLATQGRFSQALVANPTWTITDGRLQRSFDQGVTWQDVSVATVSETGAALEVLATSTRKTKDSAKRDKKAESAPTVFRAVVANGPDVWAGGSGAVLYHSSDAGTHWTRVTPASPSAILTGDILTLDFPDPQHGTVATSTAEVWTTADNGQTWRKQ